MREETRLEADPIQSVSQWLAELPDAPAMLSKRQIVARLASDIQRARDRGYTLKAIARHLQSRGFDINYNTLRDALPRQKKARAGKRKPRAGAADGARMRGDGTRTSHDGTRTNRDGTRTNHDGTRMRGDGTVMRVVAPATREGSPPKPSRSAPDEPGVVVIPPGAASMPIGGGRFVPAPDSEVL